MKVLFVGLRWDYKDPRRGDSFEFTNFYDTLSRMEGVDASLFAVDQEESKVGRKGMNQALLRTVDRVQPDLVFFLLFENELDPKTVDEVTRVVPTFNWFADDHWRFMIFSRYWAPHFTHVATTDRLSLERYRDEGIDNVTLSQWACNHYRYKPRAVTKDLDVTFVGQRHGDRSGFITALQGAGISVTTWGQGWPNGRLTTDEMIRTFSRSKVNLNLSNSSSPSVPGTLLAIARDALGGGRGLKLSEAAARLRKRRDQIKGRNFEIPGCRGLLLTSSVDDLESYYEIGTEVVVFSEIEELLEQVHYLLRNPDVRDRVAEAGYERTIRDHTYERRFRTIFEEMGLAP